jgi:plasmid stabilization system protein ParE
MVKIKWLRTAKEDVREAIDYIALDSLKYAERQLRAIKAKTQVLKTQPRGGKVVDEFQNVDILELVEGNYRITYKVISNEELHILMVHHGARKLPRLK